MLKRDHCVPHLPAILKQAVAFLLKSEEFRFLPHMLQHAFLNKIRDKRGAHFANEISGNLSVKKIFQYAKPSPTEIWDMIKRLFASQFPKTPA